MRSWGFEAAEKPAVDEGNPSVRVEPTAFVMPNDRTSFAAYISCLR